MLHVHFTCVGFNCQRDDAQCNIVEQIILPIFYMWTFNQNDETFGVLFYDYANALMLFQNVIF